MGGKLKDHWGLIKDVPGDWVRMDDYDNYPACPECGADEGDQCSFVIYDPAHPAGAYAVEVSTHVHQAREDAL